MRGFFHELPRLSHGKSNITETEGSGIPKHGLGERKQIVSQRCSARMIVMRSRDEYQDFFVAGVG
jgi:hypothetical protein